MRVLVWIVAPVLLLILIAFLILWAPLPQPSPLAFSAARNRAAAMAVGLLGLGYLVVLGVYLVGSFLGSGRTFESTLVAQGLTSQAHGLFGRSYAGEIEGRHVSVTYLPAPALWPAQLDIRVTAEAAIRAAMGMSRPLLDCRDCPRVRVDQPELEGLQVYAENGDRVANLLADPLAVGSLRSLLLEARANQLYVRPDALWLRARPRGLAESDLQRWLDDLRVVADVIENSP
jgi:hypothetical protein